MSSSGNRIRRKFSNNKKKTMAKKKVDDFEWAERLGCPKSALTEAAKKSLNQGIASLVWDELGAILRPADEVSAIRKNILLHKLRHGEPDASCLNLLKIQKTKAASRNLEPEIRGLEEKCDSADFQAREKRQKLAAVKSQRSSMKIRENILRTKLNGVRSQVEDCKEMRKICESFLPPTDTQIHPDVIDENLSLASTISTRAEGKQAMNRMSESLGGTDLSIIWSNLLSRRVRDTEIMVNFCAQEREGNPGSEETRKNINIEIARLRGDYIADFVQDKIYCMRIARNEKIVADCIEKFESSELANPLVSEWLALTLEVRKLEGRKNSYDSEIHELEKILEQQEPLAKELADLEADLHEKHTRMNNCRKDIEKSLALLKPAGTSILRFRDTLASLVERIVELRDEKIDNNYLSINPTVELNVFRENVKLEALRKIVLKNNVGVYRHGIFCMSEAARLVKAPSWRISNFPIVQAPIYRLLECFVALSTARDLRRYESEAPSENYDLGDWKSQESPENCSENSIIDIIDATDTNCDRIKGEIDEFYSLLDCWNFQTVQKAIDDRSVEGATFKDWSKRYELILHMLKSKK